MFQLDETRSRATEFFVLVIGSILALLFSDKIPLIGSDPSIFIFYFLFCWNYGFIKHYFI